MVCPKCKKEGIQNQALNKTFWYCRTCKDEIPEEPPAVAPKPSLDEYWESMRKTWARFYGTSD